MDNKYATNLNYNGHGMIERYPRNASQLYTTAHERRHAVSNKLSALAKGDEVSQNISYKVSISDDLKVIVEEGTTRSVVNHKGSSSKFEEGIDLNTELRRTNRKIDKLSNDYRGAKDSSCETGEVSLKCDRGESEKIKRELVRLESLVKKIRGDLVASGVDSKAVQSSGGTVKEDHISLRLDSSEVAESFRFAENAVPGVLLNDGVGSALRVSGALKRLDSGSRFKFPFMHFRFEKSDRYVGLRVDAFDRLADKLATLEESAYGISERESFNVHEGVSSDSGSVEIKPSFGSSEGSYSLNVSSMAQGERIVSDVVFDPFAALGVTGSFKVNGYEVSVVASDSLSDVRDKINYGEDSNKNGGLDYAEDINSNGTIDSVYIPGVMTSAGYVDAFFLYEDINSNGVLDGSEDANGNERLDGGSQNIGAVASIEGNRLVLESLAADSLHLSDGDGLLADLGFYEQDKFGVNQKRQNVILSDGTNLNRVATQAAIDLDGNDYSRSSNSINDIISETTIEIKSLPSATVDVSIRNNYDLPVKGVESFVDSYNSLLSHLNDEALSSSSFLNVDSQVQRMRGNLVRGVSDSPSESSLAPAAIGLNVVGGKRMMSQSSLLNLERLSESKGSSLSLPTSGEGTLLGGLKKIGITNRMNDTLTIDYDRLSSSIKKGLSDVVETLSGINGVSSRIRGETAKALQSGVGMIDLQKEYYKGLSGNGRDEGMRKIENLTTDKKVLGGLLDKIT